MKCRSSRRIEFRSVLLRKVVIDLSPIHLNHRSYYLDSICLHVQESGVEVEVEVEHSQDQDKNSLSSSISSLRETQYAYQLSYRLSVPRRSYYFVIPF